MIILHIASRLARIALLVFALIVVPTACLHGESVFALSLPELKSRAERGEADAQLAMGRAHEYGRGIAADPAQAMDWYLKSAAQGKGVAMRDIGRLYEAGKGVEKSIEKAVEWYRKAVATKEQTHAEAELVRLSRAGLTREKFAGISVEGGLAISVLDETTPTEQLVSDLARNTKERETGKAYWIGYNEHMLSIAGRGESAIPFLVDFVKAAEDSQAQRAGILTLHLIGIESKVAGRFYEVFSNRKAREALWQLLEVEGLTDEVAMLLKRDPWPADIPAIMQALGKVESDCPVTLNALQRYKLARSPLDQLGDEIGSWHSIRFTLPSEYGASDFVRIAIDAIKEALPVPVTLENGLLEGMSENTRLRGGGKREADLQKLLEEMTDLRPPFDFVSPGRPVYYFVERTEPDEGMSPSFPLVPNVTLTFCTAATAKRRLLEWWEKSGEPWYRFDSRR